MSFDKIVQSFRYKSSRGMAAIDQAMEDINIESVYTKTQSTKNLGLFDKKVLKDEDEIRSFKTFLFNLYPDSFFIIKSIDEQIGIKVCKRVLKCIFETIYIDSSSDSESSFELDNQSIASEASYSTISSATSFTSIYSSKERIQTYGLSEKVKKEQAKEKAKKEQEKEKAKEKAKEKEQEEREALKKKKCDFFQTKNGCYNGDACRFKH